jgi:hypothetical protein
MQGDCINLQLRVLNLTFNFSLLRHKIIFCISVIDSPKVDGAIPRTRTNLIIRDSRRIMILQITLHKLSVEKLKKEKQIETISPLVCAATLCTEDL